MNIDFPGPSETRHINGNRRVYPMTTMLHTIQTIQLHFPATCTFDAPVFNNLPSPERMHSRWVFRSQPHARLSDAIKNHAYQHESTKIHASPLLIRTRINRDLILTQYSTQQTRAVDTRDQDDDRARLSERLVRVARYPSSLHHSDH